MEIIDNINRLLGDSLKDTVKPGSRLKIAASCFSIYAYEALRAELEQVESFEFIFTAPTFVPGEATDKVKKDHREFHIPKLERERSLYGSEFEVRLRNELTQRAIAKECAGWMRKKAIFRSNRGGAPMQQFATVVSTDTKSVYMPLRGFTAVDLGYEKGNAVSSFVHRFDDPAATQSYLSLFDQIWSDPQKLEDVIFVSIDDNEATNLRTVCDEIFGSDNFVATIVWQRSKKGDAKLIAGVHEYIICYARNKTALAEAGVWRRKKEGADEVLAKYAELKASFSENHDKIREAMQTWYRSLAESDPRKAHKHYNWSDSRGLYFAADFAGPDDGRVSRPRHDILHPVTRQPCKKPSTGWRWDGAKTKWALEQQPPRIHFGPDETTIPNRKSYLHEISVEPYPSVFYRDGRSATLEVENLVGKGWFEFPKNTDVLAELIELASGPDDLVLDFFAGSGSTGHAVSLLNATKKSKRRFILVQLPEQTGRSGYATIADIAKKRIRSAGEAIKAEYATTAPNLDTGFRVLKIDTSNMKDVYYLPDAVKQEDLALHTDNIKEGRSPEDLLFQVLVDWGVDLALSIEKQTIAGHTVFLVDGNALAACFDPGVGEDLVKELAKRKPLRAVFRDASFAGDSVKINVEQIFKLLSPDTEVKSL